MPLFRFHRGSLHESLQTTIIVKTFNEMVKAIIDSFDENMLTNAQWGARFSVEAYPDKESCFDRRIGWFTHIVTTNLYGEDKMHAVGFLSEPFWSNKNELG